MQNLIKSGAVRHFANFLSMFYCFHYIARWESLQYLSQSSLWNLVGWYGLHFITGFVLGRGLEMLQAQLIRWYGDDDNATVSESDVKAYIVGGMIGALLFHLLPDFKEGFGFLLAVALHTTYLGIKPLVALLRKK